MWGRGRFCSTNTSDITSRNNHITVIYTFLYPRNPQICNQKRNFDQKIKSVFSKNNICKSKVHWNKHHYTFCCEIWNKMMHFPFFCNISATSLQNRPQSCQDSRGHRIMGSTEMCKLWCPLLMLSSKTAFDSAKPFVFCGMAWKLEGASCDTMISTSWSIKMIIAMSVRIWQHSTSTVNCIEKLCHCKHFNSIVSSIATNIVNCSIVNENISGASQTFLFLFWFLIIFLLRTNDLFSLIMSNVCICSGMISENSKKHWAISLFALAHGSIKNCCHWLAFVVGIFEPMFQNCLSQHWIVVTMHEQFSEIMLSVRSCCQWCGTVQKKKMISEIKNMASSDENHCTPVPNERGHLWFTVLGSVERKPGGRHVPWFVGFPAKWGGVKRDWSRCHAQSATKTGPTQKKCNGGNSKVSKNLGGYKLWL